MLRCLCLVAASACEAPDVEALPASAPDSAAPKAERVALQLETRDGDSRLGYSFAANAQVDSHAADLLLNAFDCGARGRWVNLVGNDVRLCHTAEQSSETCAHHVSVGGSDGAFEGQIFVKRGEQLLGKVTLVDHSPTPQAWYTQSPMPAFDVTLEIVR